MKRLLVTICLLLGSFGTASAFECSNPPADLQEITDPCNCDLIDPACQALYLDGRICLIQPVAEQNINATEIRFAGRLKDYEDLQNLVDLVVAVSNLLDPNTILDQVDPIGWDEIYCDGSFSSELNVGAEGLFQTILQAVFFAEETGTIDKVSEVREILRVGRPHMQLTQIRAKNTGEPVYEVTPSSEPVDPARADQRVTASTDGVIGTTGLDLCLTPEAGDTTTGTDLTLTVENRVIDPSAHFEGDESFRKTLVNRTVLEVHAAALQPAGGFCAGGFIVNLPLGHGENRLTIEVDNPLTGNGRGEIIEVDPIANDIRGPKLCVKFFRDEDLRNEIRFVDGLSLTTSLPAVVVDATVCPEEPDTLHPPSHRRNWADVLCHEDSPVCIHKNNRQGGNNTPLIFPMVKRTIAGVDHYISHFDDTELRFPINTFTLKAQDIRGNVSEATHSFGFGQIRSMAAGPGTSFSWRNALTPNAASLFLPSSYVDGELKTVLLRVLNSEKFKNDLPKLIVPKVLTTAEVQLLRRDAGCDDAYSRDKTRVIQLYRDPDLDDFEFFDSLQIQRLEMMSGNRIHLTVAINGLRGDGEIFTIDTSQHRDLFDDFLEEGADGDGDGRPNFTFDEDGNPQSRDFPGVILPDDVMQSSNEPGRIIPVKLTTHRLTVDLLITVTRPNGLLRFDFSNAVEDVPSVSLVGEEHGDDGPWAFALDCERDRAHTRFNGVRGTLLDHEVCESAWWANVRNNNLGTDDSCLNQNLDQQVLFLLREMVEVLLPNQLMTDLQRFQNEAASTTKVTMFDHDLNMETYLPILESEIEINPIGLSLKIPALLAPAGITGDGGSTTAAGFVQNELRQLVQLPPTLELGAISQQFGALREFPSGEAVDPADEISYLGSELNLALSEEFINSILASSNALLAQLGRVQPDFLDLSTTKLRELGIAATDTGAEHCLDSEGVNPLDDHLGPGGADDPTNNWRCFPYSLDVGTIIGSSQIPGESVIPGIPPETPVVIRTKLNPLAPITARLIELSPLAAAGNDSSRPSSFVAELELGLRDAEMGLYEGVLTPSTEADGAPVVHARNWCDRQPGAHPRCQTTEGDEGLPIAKLKTSGRIFLKLIVDQVDDGNTLIHGGVFGRLAGRQVTLDSNRSYLKVSMIVNNTIVPDQTIVDTFKINMDNILSQYVANSAGTIWGEQDLSITLEDLCEDNESLAILCDYGESAEISGASVDDLLMGLTGGALEDFDDTSEPYPSRFGSPRYLELGVGLCVENNEEECIRPPSRRRWRFW